MPKNRKLKTLRTDFLCFIGIIRYFSFSQKINPAHLYRRGEDRGGRGAPFDGQKFWCVAPPRNFYYKIFYFHFRGTSWNNLRGTLSDIEK